MASLLLVRLGGYPSPDKGSRRAALRSEKRLTPPPLRTNEGSAPPSSRGRWPAQTQPIDATRAGRRPQVPAGSGGLGLAKREDGSGVAGGRRLAGRDRPLAGPQRGGATSPFNVGQHEQPL